MCTLMPTQKYHIVQHIQENNLSSSKNINWFLLKLPELISSFSVILSGQGHIQI